ncbi:beta-eliminating lyase-related protein [Deefgea sp. CFH1-16]|uniref:beta-eliminating lyase-related protein n=1 Tax=Deefgea sp. CFH1-16 TaxID=2675457 RepID=UPI001FFDE2EC|nr:beta-eliminating lyase-related protein [Deefgea sp. CFH1-16]
MRQVGVLAAPGLLALNAMTERLADDHRHAKLLAAQLAKIDGIVIDLDSVQINMVWFNFSREIDVDKLMQSLANANIKSQSTGARRNALGDALAY